MNSDQWSVDEYDPIAAGTEIGVYRIEAPIGEGGMGTVYRARDRKLNRAVAIKFLSADLTDAAARQRFQREAQLASSLNHPHILTVHDAGEFEGCQYLVTEFVDGGTLRDWSKPKRSWQEVVGLLTGVADGLAAAHQAGILHRDIKPANILVAKNGYAKLADFGLARLAEHPEAELTRTLTEGRTRPGVIVGTIPYMSPEQASGQPLDARSDIFSFGVVLYELLAGRRPFVGKTELETLQKVIHETPPPLGADAPPALRLAVEKALAKNPEERYQSMREIVVDLRRVAHQRIDERRLRPGWAVAAAAVAVVAGGVWIAFRPQQPAAPSPQQYVQLTNLDSATQPALSPDGRLMAFVRGTSAFIGAGQIYVKVLPDGDPVQLTHDELHKMFPRFSPDGTRIAYSTLDVGAFDTWIVPVLGGQEPAKLLANAEGLNWIQETNAAGALQPRILFSQLTGKGITMSVVSSTESRADQRTVFLRDGVMDHFSYLSPDRKQLLLAEMGYNGWLPCRVAPYDGSSMGRQVGPSPAQCTSAAWTPDGRWMYFSINTGGGFHIWRQRYPDGTPEQVTFGATEEEGIEFAADGQSFLTSIGTRQSTLWVHDSRGDRQVTSDAYAFQPSFSSDGRKLYYLARTSTGTSAIPRGRLWVLDLESGERLRLLSDYQMEQYTVSQDGQRVVFIAVSDTGPLGVWLARLDGRSAPLRLTGSYGVQTYFAGGGDVLFTVQEDDGAFVYRIGQDGEGLRRAIQDPIFSPYGVSPDGEHMAAWVLGSTEETASSVMVYPLDGGTPARVCGNCAFRDTEFSQPVGWSADGGFVYFAFGGFGVYAVPLRAGQILPALPPLGLRSPEDAVALPGARAFRELGAFPGPNPSIYAYSRQSAQRNIYRVPVQ